ncbi:acetylxylan esterase [Microbacterium gilvum]|uniref:Acetylxylan esterase n=1 Tax=Microbacterium gilvum TaxID=1336204 RepID=A0ABP9A772_9MICO
MRPGEELTIYDLAGLLSPPAPLAEPDDFDAFWGRTRTELLAPGLDVAVEEEVETAAHTVQRISFASSAGERATAWLALPAAPVHGGLVFGHGYGGRDAPEMDRVPAGVAAVFPVANGFSRYVKSAFPAIGSDHVLHGIADRETYAHRFAVADIWRAASLLLDAAPGARHRLDYLGVSFGGGIGALALAFDDRFRRAVLDVPSFGHFPMRLSRLCTGSGEAVRRHLVDHPEDRATLDWFDAAIAARRIRIPVLVAAALQDPSVDPRGQFAVYHALGGEKRLTVREVGHLDGPLADEAERRVRRHGVEFLAAGDLAEIPGRR